MFGALVTLSQKCWNWHCRYMLHCGRYGDVDNILQHLRADKARPGQPEAKRNKSEQATKKYMPNDTRALRIPDPSVEPAHITIPGTQIHR